MWTNTFLNLSKIAMMGASTAVISSHEFTDVAGETKYMAIASSSLGYPSNAAFGTFSNQSNINYSGWHVGSGNTPATINDYTLENRINPVNTLSANVTVTDTYDSTLLKYNRKVKITIENISQNTITINEIGLVQGVRGFTSSESSPTQNYMALFWRHVFDESIILAPNDITTIIIDLYALFS